MNIHGVGTSIVESHSSIAILSLSIASLHFESEDSRLLLHIRTVDCLYTRIHPTHNCMLPNSRHPLSLSPSFFQRHVYSHHLVGSPLSHPFRISGLVARCDNVHPVTFLPSFSFSGPLLLDKTFRRSTASEPSVPLLFSNRLPADQVPNTRAHSH